MAHNTPWKAILMGSGGGSSHDGLGEKSETINNASGVGLGSGNLGGGDLGSGGPGGDD